MGKAPGKQIDDAPMKPPPSAKKYAAPDSPVGVTEENEFSVRIAVNDGGIASVELVAEEDDDTGAAEPEAPPDPEQLRLHEEFLEEQRGIKAQYEATQKVQAIARGKAARAEVEAKKAEIAAAAATPPEPVAEPAAEEAPAEPSG